jgi:hypothetical protein
VAGGIVDYYLFPAGHLVTRTLPDGTAVRRATVASGAAHMTRDGGLRSQWRKVEEVAGVAHVPGRRWYGVRRRQADEGDALDVRPTVKNRLGGWTKDSTRQGYLEAGRHEDAVDAAEARRKIRPNARERSQ